MHAPFKKTTVNCIGNLKVCAALQASCLASGRNLTKPTLLVTLISLYVFDGWQPSSSE